MKYEKYKLLAAKRREEIYQMHLDNPDMTHEQIGEKFDGIKKQRVRQIIEAEKAKLATRAPVKSATK